MKSVKQKHPLFYGWWIVILSFMATAYGGAVIWYGFTAFFNPLIKEFGWSYTQISIAASFRSIETGLLGVFIGFVVDRLGSRRIVLTGSILTSIGFVLLSRVNSLSSFYALFILVFIGSTGISSVVFFQALTHWFRKRLGLALGIASAGFGAGGLAVPGIVFLMDLVGFRTFFVLAGVGILIVGGVTSYFLRDRPEQMGLVPDGELPDEVVQSTLALNQEKNHTFRQALKDRVFWMVTYVSTVSGISIMLTSTHVMPYLENIGYNRYAASIVAMTIPVASIAGRLGMGWVSDLMSRRTTFLISTLGQAVGVALFIFAGVSPAFIVPFVIFFSIGYGGNLVLRPGLLRDRYGSANIGAILGLSLGTSSLISLVGPLFGGWIFDQTGSYDISWIISSALLLLGVPLIMLTKSPTDEVRPARKE